MKFEIISNIVQILSSLGIFVWLARIWKDPKKKKTKNTLIVILSISLFILLILLARLFISNQVEKINFNVNENSKKKIILCTDKQTDYFKKLQSKLNSGLKLLENPITLKTIFPGEEKLNNLDYSQLVLLYTKLRPEIIHKYFVRKNLKLKNFDYIKHKYNKNAILISDNYINKVEWNDSNNGDNSKYNSYSQIFNNEFDQLIIEIDKTLGLINGKNIYANGTLSYSMLMLLSSGYKAGDLISFLGASLMIAEYLIDPENENSNEGIDKIIEEKMGNWHNTYCYYPEKSILHSGSSYLDINELLKQRKDTLVNIEHEINENIKTHIERMNRDNNISDGSFIRENQNSMFVECRSMSILSPDTLKAVNSNKLDEHINLTIRNLIAQGKPLDKIKFSIQPCLCYMSERKISRIYFRLDS